MGKLMVCVAENGHSYALDCDQHTLVEAAQKYLESVCGIPYNDQLLLCLDMKLESHRPLSSCSLPSDDREVFLFNKARMRSNSAPPVSEHIEIVDIPDPLSPSSIHSPHPLDGASDPASIALASYEKQFRHHFQCGLAVYSRTLAKIKIFKRLLQEQQVQQRAMEIARGNLEHFYGIVMQNYRDFMKCYLQQHRSHTSLLVNFCRDMEKLRSIRLIPSLQSDNRKCLLDFVKEENLQKTVEDCSNSHGQFENKVLEFKHEFGELKHHTENLFSAKAPFLVKELDLTINGCQRFIDEQESIMQALRKDVHTVKKLVDDCLSNKLSSSVRPHDAVSALGPMYESHESYLPKMQTCESEISSFLDFCRDKKNDMNMFVHGYMQSVAYVQYLIKDVRYKFSVFQEALKHQDDQFDQLKVVRGIGPAYRACLAEIVRRKAAMKIYMGKAGKLAEKLAIERDAEVRRREEFLQVQNTYIPRDILASMGLYDMPNPCDVNVNPFDTNLLDIDLSDIDRFAPESFLGKSKKNGPLRGSFSTSNDGPGGGIARDLNEKYDELVEGSELVEIAGTCRMEVENAKLKAELASKIALLCSMSTGFDYESPGNSNLLDSAAEKTSEALRLKDEYAKHLQSMLNAKQMQCESYEKRIQELEQQLSAQYPRGCELPADDDANSSVSIAETNFKLGVEELRTTQATEEVSCTASLLNSEPLLGLDEKMTDSSALLNPQLDSSMLDLHSGKGNLFDVDKKETSSSDEGAPLAASNMVVSMSQLVGTPPYETATESDLDAKVNDNIMELQNVLAEKSKELEDSIMELQNVLAEKSKELENAENNIRGLTDKVSKLERELEISRKLVDESQMNCAHLENSLHEAREEAQTHLCAANRRASEYNALRASAVKMRGLFGRLRGCVLSTGVATFPDSLCALAKSLGSMANENKDDSFVEFHECIRVLANKVGGLSGQRMESLIKTEAAKEKLNKELEEKNKLISALYIKHQMEKQANKERISFGQLEVHEIAAFVLNSCGNYEAINRNIPYYYLSSESIALFIDDLPSRPIYIVGQVVHIEQRTVKSPSLTLSEHAEKDGVDILTSDIGTNMVALNAGLTSNPYGLPVGCDYFIVTIAMLPSMTMRWTPS